MQRLYIPPSYENGHKHTMWKNVAVVYFKALFRNSLNRLKKPTTNMYGQPGTESRFEQGNHKYESGA
jgi:hypothetical protein